MTATETSLARTGSLRRLMNSGNSFSPSSVPPPRLLRKLRPSSADRAENAPPISRTRSPVAVGSSTTVYLPGSSLCGFFHFRHFSMARAASPALSNPEIFVDG